MPPRPNEYVRISVKMRLDGQSELSSELTKLPPFARAKRLLELASVGLLVLKSGVAIGTAVPDIEPTFPRPRRKKDMPPRPTVYVRISVKMRLDGQSELSSELTKLPPFGRAKRLLELASVGLLVLKNGIAIGTAIPNIEPTSVATNQTSTQAITEVAPNVVAAALNYGHDLSNLWGSGQLLDV